MTGKSFTMALHVAFLSVVFATQFLDTKAHFIDAKKVRSNSVEMEPFLEYHFHTYFDVNDPVQVAQAIQLRNELIANCVAKKIIAVPLHWNYDPENPVLERKITFSSFYEIFSTNLPFFTIGNQI